MASLTSVPGKPLLLAMLMDVPESKSHVIPFFHIGLSGVTALLMIVSEIVARFYRSSQPIPASTNTTNQALIVNPLPFSTLNIAIALSIVFNIILYIFGLSIVNGSQLALVLLALLVTNKKARKHLRNRLRQNMDSFTVGRSSRVGPVVSIALVNLPTRDLQGSQKTNSPPTNIC